MASCLCISSSEVAVTSKHPIHGARKRTALLWALLVFMAVQFVAGLLLDYRWPMVRFPEAVRQLSIPHTAQHAPNFLCLGSSRFEGELLAPEITKLLRQQFGHERPLNVFNGSIGAGEPVAMEFMFDKLFKDGVRPKIVVLEINPDTVSRKSMWVSLHIRRQLRWDNCLSYLPDIYRSGEIFRFLAMRLLPLYYYRLNIWSEIREGPPRAGLAPEMTANAGASPVRWDELLQTQPRPLSLAEEALFEHGAEWMNKSLNNYRVGGAAGAALERLVKKCRQNQMEVILVSPPISTYLRRRYTSEVNVPFAAYVRHLVERYDCSYVDEREALPDYLFKDVHHVSGEGGLYFSRLLTRQVLIPAWERQLSASAPGRGRDTAALSAPGLEKGETAMRKQRGGLGIGVRTPALGAVK
jgi:hypothetical protein